MPVSSWMIIVALTFMTKLQKYYRKSQFSVDALLSLLVPCKNIILLLFANTTRHITYCSQMKTQSHSYTIKRTLGRWEI